MFQIQLHSVNFKNETKLRNSNSSFHFHYFLPIATVHNNFKEINFWVVHFNYNNRWIWPIYYFYHVGHMYIYIYVLMIIEKRNFLPYPSTGRLSNLSQRQSRNLIINDSGAQSFLHVSDPTVGHRRSGPLVPHSHSHWAPRKQWNACAFYLLELTLGLCFFF